MFAIATPPAGYDHRPYSTRIGGSGSDSGGLEQARKHGYPIPLLAETLADEGKILTKTQFTQLQDYFEENSWQGPAELLFNEDGTEVSKPPSRKLVEYLCWGSAGAEE